MPVLVYGPSLVRWRQAAGSVYMSYKAQQNMDKGKPTGTTLNKAFRFRIYLVPRALFAV
jgi:hypothetical protein